MVNNSCKKVLICNLNQISYKEAWQLQQKVHDAVKGYKLSIRNKENIDPSPYHFLLICEHSPVFTLGKTGSRDNLLVSETELEKNNIDYFEINRGGDITYHGLGQIVGYPIFDLDEFFTDIHKYVRFLEQAVIDTMAEYEVTGSRIEDFTGVWIEDDSPMKRKICAIGVHLSRWVTLHGFAFNVVTNLENFNKIVPCGIDDENKTVTSLHLESKKEVQRDEVVNLVTDKLSTLFEFEKVEIDLRTLNLILSNYKPEVIETLL